MAYFEQLLTQRVLEPDDLTRLAENLERGVLTNPLADGTGRSTLRLVHARQMENFLRLPLDLAELSAWTTAHLAQMNHNSAERDIIRDETSFIGSELEMRTVFEHSTEYYYTQLYTNVPSFELMRAPVTQDTWIQIMRSNPSRFQGAQNPVENVTWWAAAEFANRVSKRLGFKPYYDMSAVDWEPGTSAEAGTLRPTSEHLLGNKWQELTVVGGEGYRFLMPAEWTYLRHTIHLSWVMANSPHQEISEMAWWKYNSNGHTHPVGTRRPHFIHGKSFYDLIGNVEIWCNIEDYEMPNTSGATLAPKLRRCDTSLVKGGFEGTTEKTEWSIHILGDFNSHPFTETTAGIRLARTLPPRKGVQP